MSDNGIVFEKSEWESGRYEVQYQESGGYRWERDSWFSRKSTAIARAEALLRERGVSRVQVLDTKARDES